MSVFAKLQAAFEPIERRFPPISDEEYLALFPPGTNADIALRVRRVISETCDIPYECIYPSAHFVDDLGLD